MRGTIYALFNSISYLDIVCVVLFIWGSFSVNDLALNCFTPITSGWWAA